VNSRRDTQIGENELGKEVLRKEGVDPLRSLICGEENIDSTLSLLRKAEKGGGLFSRRDSKKECKGGEKTTVKREKHQLEEEWKRRKIRKGRTGTVSGPK